MSDYRIAKLTEDQAKRILGLVTSATTVAGIAPTDVDIAIGNHMRVILASFAAERVMSPQDAADARRRRALREGP